MIFTTDSDIQTTEYADEAVESGDLSTAELNQELLLDVKQEDADAENFEEVRLFITTVCRSLCLSLSALQYLLLCLTHVETVFSFGQYFADYCSFGIRIVFR